ncbi:Rne/Rng family ribonuclease [Thermoleophilum album]|uniref:Ribonuclease G n=1 Tax=Thermoleophilum album TaxID=29539 RepID=A0A1H6FVW6_THEAL|nr:Rne/Rng family ribonuclease [Thermoleophilum album]SEH13935.1 ribonuclease G [Thermoleophilum album]
MRKQVLVAVDRGETRVAILEAEGSVSSRQRSRQRGSRKTATDWRVAEIYIERRGARSIVGNVYKGRVDNVLPGLEAAFVDIGLEKNGFLHSDDIVLPGVEVARRGRAGKGKRISELLRPGQEILVQVVKDPLKTKGPRLSMQLSIAGRYLVYVPQGEGIGVSRRLDDAERARLRRELQKVALPEGGWIVRTAAQGAKREDFEREVLYLRMLYDILRERAERSPAPALVFQGADLPVRVVRDIFSDEFERALVDDEKAYERLVSFLSRTAPELVERVELDSGEPPLFERFGVDRALRSTLERRVDLPSGGYLVIDYAEAMTVIDVNSGSFTGRGKGAKLEDTITKTNLEAADEVVRQLRLRDIGGIIVIDFIDMARARNRDAVLRRLREALERDRTKTYVVEVSPLGLVEMTRQNVTEGVREILTKPCPTCNGEGVVLSEETVAFEAARWLREIAFQHPAAEALLIRMNPRVSAILTRGPGRPIEEIEAETGKRFHFEGTEALPIDHMEVVMAGSADEVAERALPFREGDEVLVELVEPHMYNEGDAVAKLDGYVIAVRGAADLVGQKALVRIERVGRSSAEASLVAQPEASGAGGGEGQSRTPAVRRRRARREAPATS